jgi:hypothetical protein
MTSGERQARYRANRRARAQDQAAGPIVLVGTRISVTDWYALLGLKPSVS